MPHGLCRCLAYKKIERRSPSVHSCSDSVSQIWLPGVDGDTPAKTLDLAHNGCCIVAGLVKRWDLENVVDGS